MSTPGTTPAPRESSADTRGLWRGIMWGLLLCLPFWLAVAATVLVLLR